MLPFLTHSSPHTGNKAKKMAALDIVVTLFRVYFALNTLRLCKNLVAAVGSRQFPPFDAFPAAQRVTYKYFTGRLAIFDEAYAEADADLSYALAHCPRTATANRARAAFFLVPVRLLRGALPSPRLLDGCGLADAYGPLVDAVRAGDVGGLDALLAARQWDHVRAGTFLLLEKLRPAAARRLLKKVAVLHALADPAKAAQLPLAKFAAALASQGAPAGDDDVECLVATLVARRYVKGYVAHTHRVLVLSKVDPFPPLETALGESL
jgi:nuclear mRNA export protein PCID2/THP1